MNNYELLQAINESGGGGGGSSKHDYSVDEQVIGKWINGKPLYEKVINFHFDSVSYRSTQDITAYLPADIDMVINAYGYGNYPYEGVQEYYPINSTTFTYPYANANSFHINIGNISGELDVTLIIQYTKTTD